MTPALKRRWFRFSLRTLFVVVTVIGIWLGYSLNWIHERHEFVGQRLAPVGHSHYPRTITTGQVTVKAPGALWLFGERGHAHLKVGVFQGGLNHAPDARRELEMAQRLFPEAQVTCAIILDE